MIYFGPGPEWYEIAVVLCGSLIVVGFIIRGIIKSEERKLRK